MQTIQRGSLEQEALQLVQPVDWKYELRRSAQEILPGVYVGPYQSGTKLDTLQSLGITHILVVTDERETLFLRPRFPDQFVYKVLTVRDAQDQNLIRLFPDAISFINTALSSSGKVLVHCGDGISRSPAIVTAYVMQTFHLKQEDAFAYVQARRFCISPNQGFQVRLDDMMTDSLQHQLEAYQHIAEAQLAISLDRSAGLRDVRRKRSGSDDEVDEPAVKRSAAEFDDCPDMEE